MSAAGEDAVRLRVGGRELRVARPGKVLWAAAGFTKRDLLDYDLAVAPALLPHLAGRAVTLGRWPDGVAAPGWYQSNRPPGAPEWLPAVEVAGARGQLLRYCRLEEPAALAWAAAVAAIELHPLLATADRPAAPRALVLDLDPAPPAGLLDACAVALRARDHLAGAGLAALVKTSGAKGLHVVVPLDGAQGFASTRAFARALAGALAAEAPDRVTARRAGPARAGRVLVDWPQNAPGLSLAAPYTLRATRLPRASTPVTWEEVETGLGDGDASRLVFGPADVLARLERVGDLLAPALAGAQRLPAGAPWAGDEPPPLPPP